ncbi:ATPase domain-containing protein [Caulobacter soli]|uniref:ATPase domain-containing protein n=1 Tax=Caulobacter soli TaxID=2708539 RepID=UPI0013E9A485|nr:ATPase domain-containing protein [Caulobacter soli]
MPIDLTIPRAEARVVTGVPGLDEILGGGLTRDRIYLVEGTPGSGKTTLALQFLLKGRELGESGLYITLSETETELRAAAASHGWSLDGIDLFELVSEEGLDPDSEQSVLHPSDVELGETTRGVMTQVEETKPMRVVFDSLSEMRLLAQNPLRHRRQILALKHFFATRQCTVLLLDDQTAEHGDLQLHSIAHGVISLQRTPQEYGSQRRRLEVVKMRGIKYRGGFHDFELDTGGIRVFERLVAARHHADFTEELVSTGTPGLDALIGGGLSRGTNTLISGPSGVGKTTTAIRCALSALERGEKVAYYLFDEGLPTLLARSKSLGMSLRPYVDSGQLLIRAIDPAELSPGEFAFQVRDAVEQGAARLVVIDSLNAYLQAMPGQKFLLLQMHELLTYLNQQGVVTLLILGQHGFIGEVRSDIDLSYLSDGILLFRFFEAAGSIRTAISAVKSRTTEHEKTIREIRLTSEGIEVGEALSDFQGVMSGLPSYEGKMAMLGDGEPPAHG